MIMSAESITAEKSELRRTAKLERAQLDFVIKREYDRQIADRLLSLEQYNAADVILTYISVGNEVGTDGIIKQAFKDGKTVAVPVCQGEKMSFYVIEGSTELHKTDFGILEPDPENCTKQKSFENALCIVPALLFDRQGYRIGYGGGYYDKFLKNTGVKTVGLCYNSFIADFLPVSAHDIPVEIIITQNEIINAR